MQDSAQSSMVTDALIGAAAGAAAVWIMDRIDNFNFDHADPEARARTKAVRPGGMDPAHVAANTAAEAVGAELEPRDDNAAGMAVHYALGMMPGVVYGALRREIPALTTGAGTLYGLGLFLLQDEGVNAATGLSAQPDEYPWQAHARGLVGHLGYGAALDATLNLTDSLRGR